MSDILICDDDRSFARWVATSLGECGYTVHVSDVGPRGVRDLLSGCWRVVVLGVHAGSADGLELIPLIHQIDRDLPIVAVADQSSLEMERQARLQKVFYYMVRPIDFGEMKEVVSLAFGCGRLAAISRSGRGSGFACKLQMDIVDT